MDGNSKLHIASIVCRAIDDMKGSIIVVTGGMFVYQGGVRNLRYLLPFLLLYFLVVTLWEGLRWVRFTYTVEETGDITISSGVLRRRHRTVPFDQIECVRLLESPASRLFGVTGLYCETAGANDESEVELRYVSPATATRLRQTLESGRLDRRDDIRSAAKQLYRLSFRQVIGYSLLQSHYAVVILTVGTVISVALLPVETSASVTALVVASVRSTLPFGAGLSQWGILVLLAVSVGWTVGVVRSAVRMYGFQLFRDGETLYRRHGLISRVEDEIPIANVQIVRRSDNPILRLLGWAELDVQTAGGSDMMPFESRTTLVPLARREDIDEIASQVVSVDFDGREKTPIRARRRYFVRYLLFVLLAVAVSVLGRRVVPAIAAIPLSVSLLPVALVPVAAHVRWASISYTFGADHLYIRSGFWRRREYVLRYENIQQHTISQSLFQRRHRLSTLRVETAAYPLAIGATVPDIDAETAVEFSDRQK